MTEELKPCPFCGGRGRKLFGSFDEYGCENNDPYIEDITKYCGNDVILTREEWQKRPTEDALNKGIAQLKIEVDCMSDHVNELYLLLVDNPQTRKLADAIYVRMWTRYVREMKELK